MNKLLTLLFIIITTVCNGTEQEPDLIYYEGNCLSLFTGFYFPSPLETYFYQNKIKYPFDALSTANYRGHIASWIIVNDSLFLTEIAIQGKRFQPSDYNIASKDSTNSKNGVFADWFSGIISSSEYRHDTIVNLGDRYLIDSTSTLLKTYYFHLRNGKLIDKQIINEEGSEDHGLTSEYNLLNLNENYISYYLRLGVSDQITFQNKKGYLKGNYGLSPILILYTNDHLKWPYNWENESKSGAPNCNWHISNDSLFLDSVTLKSGLSYNSIKSVPIALNEIFPLGETKEYIFGDWVSGVYSIEYGERVAKDKYSNYKTFEVSEYILFRLNKGIVKEYWLLPGDFNFNKLKKNIEPGLKRVIQELKAHNIRQ